MHVMFIVGFAVLLVLVIVYPFLPGGYDHLAVPLSTMAQAFGVMGVPLILIGLSWLLMPGRRFVFAVISTIAGTFVELVLVIIATFTCGTAFGVITLVAWVYVLFKMIPILRKLKNDNNDNFNIAPLYLITLPGFALIFQLVLSSSLTQWSRSHAISNANEFIGDIEKYHARNGRYPVSLQSQNKDYYPDVVGVEKYYYSPQGSAYNLYFEQPRFLLDRIGTREWVVYNPQDENRVYSHTAWILHSNDVELSQGWYGSGDTEYSHWKYFLFD